MAVVEATGRLFPFGLLGAARGDGHRKPMVSPLVVLLTNNKARVSVCRGQEIVIGRL